MKILSDESQKRYNIMKLQYHDGENTQTSQHPQNITILKLDKNLEQELHISNKIYKIPFFHLYFQTIHIKKQLSYVNSRSTKQPLQTEEIPLEYWERILPSNNNTTDNPFTLVETSSNLTNSTRIYNYDEWFNKFDNKKEILSNIINLILFVFDGLYILQKHDVLLLNFSKSNLCFNQFGKPFICKFNHCIEKTSLHKISQITSSNNDSLNEPIEMFVMDYLRKNKEIYSLSNHQIELIVKKYTDNHSIISNLSVHMREKYYDDSVTYLQVLKNKPIIEILDFLLNHANTWDNYGFHMFFLKDVLLNDTNATENVTTNTKTIPFMREDSKVFWKGFIDIFMKNILCNPNELHNIEETKHIVVDYLNTKMKHLHV
jgi:hypothetical protein